MSKENKTEFGKIRLSTIFKTIVFVFFFLILILYFSRESHPYIDLTGLFLIGIFCLILFGFLFLSEKYPALIVIIFILILFLLSRFFIYVLYPESFFGDFRGEYEIFNSALIYIILGTLASFFGVIFAYKLVKIKKIDFKSELNPNIFGVLTLIFIVIQLFVFFKYGYVGDIGSGENLNFFVRYVSRFFNVFVALLVFLVMYQLYQKKTKNLKNLFVFVVIAYFLQLLIMGSRSGIFEVVVLLLCLKVFFEGNFSFKIKPAVFLIVLLLIPIAIFGYVAATEIRYSQRVLEETSFSGLARNIANINIFNFDYKSSLMSISRRLSLFEQVVYTMFPGYFGFNDVSELVNIKTTLLSSINRVFPGKFFDVINTEYAFGYIMNKKGVLLFSYSGVPNYVGYEWGMHALSYQLFGYVGGLIFIFLFSGFLVYLVNLAHNKKSIFWICFGIFILYTLHTWIRTFGIDNILDKTSSSLVLLILYLLIYVFFSGKKLVFK